MPSPVLAAIVPTATIIVDQNLATLAQEAQPAITAMVCQTLLYGIYASIFVPTILTLIFSILSLIKQLISIFRNRRPRTKPWFFILSTTTIMFLLSTICLVLEVVSAMGVLNGIKLETQGSFQPPTAWYGFRGANDRTLVQAILFSLEFMLGDAIVVWRAGALWEFDWNIMIPMTVALLGDFATILYFIGCEGQADWWYIAGTQPKSCNVSQRGIFFLSFGTNVLATFFIALKAWNHRQAFVAKPSSLSSSGTWKKRWSPAQKIMLLFLESGLLYMFFWAACSFTYFPFVLGIESPAYFMTDLFNSIRYQVVGLYPTAIVLLVHRESSSWDTPEVSTSLRMDFKAAPGQAGHPSPIKRRHNHMSTLNFAVSTMASGVANSNELEMIDEAQVESKISIQNSSDGQASENFKQVPVQPPPSHERSHSDGPSITSAETLVV